MKKENECLTYQEELIMIHGIVNEILENEININDRIEKLERKSLIYGIMFLVIVIVMIIIKFV